MKYNLLFILLLPLLLGECSKDLDSAIHKLYNRKIDMSWEKIYISDNEVFENYEFVKPIKIVVYVDTVLCLSCFADYLKAANQYMQTQNRDSIEYICVLRPRPIELVQNMLQNIKHSEISVVMDVDDVFLKKNSLDKYTDTLTAFMLDENNRIVVIGDPVRSIKVRSLFKKTFILMKEKKKNKRWWCWKKVKLQ